VLADGSRFVPTGRPARPAGVGRERGPAGGRRERLSVHV